MRYLLLIVLLTTSQFLTGQGKAISSELTFHSTYERYLYSQKDPYKTKDFLKYYLATSPEINKEAVAYIKSQLNELFQYFERKNLRKKSPKRAVKLINEHLYHTYFLLKKEWVGFEDVFKKKTYNHTTASALYILILEHFDLPYTISQKQEGIIITLHKKKKTATLLEPKKQETLAFQNFKNYYIELLKELNIIEKTTFNKAENDSLFTHYYMPPESPLNAVQITGNLYFIQAMQTFKEKKYSSTIDLLYKAQMFLPLPRNQVMKQATLYQLAGSIDIRKTADIQYLFSIYKAFPIPEIKQELLFSFRQIAEYFLHKKNDKLKYQSLFQQFYQVLKEDRLLRNKLEKIYFSELAAYYAQQKRTDIVLQYMDSLYTRWPENEEINHIIANKFVKSIRETQDYDYGIKQIEYQMNRYPFLRDNKTIQDCHLMYYSRRGRDYFETEEIYEGIKMLETFEILAKKYKHTPNFDMWVKTIYIPASYAYFADKSYEEALSLIKKALVYLPDDSFLNHRLELLMNY